MSTDKVVISEVQTNRSLTILELFAECVSESGKTPHVQASSGIQALHVAGRYQLQSGVAISGYFSVPITSMVL